MSEEQKEEKEYSIEDVIAAQEPREVRLSFKDGYLRFKIIPISSGMAGILARMAKDNPEVLTNLQLKEGVRCIVKENGIDVEKRLTDELLSKMPPGLKTALINQVNLASGFGLDFRVLKK